MKTYKLVKQNYYNPYFVEGSVAVWSIHFFSEGKVLCAEHSGWIGAGSNNGDNLEYSDLEFVRRMDYKQGLEKGVTFFHTHRDGNKLFINIDDLTHFKFTKGTRWFGSDKFQTHLIDKVELAKKDGSVIEMTIGRAYGTTNTPLGDKKDAIRAALETIVDTKHEGEWVPNKIAEVLASDPSALQRLTDACND